jgi:hypothetical protein
MTLERIVEIDFVNTDCEATSSCSLKRVWFEVRYFVMHFKDGLSLVTTMVAGYESDSIDTLEDYVFVQKIRGCTFGSYKDDNGLVSYNIIQTIRQFGVDVIYNLPRWGIDSLDTDPVYNSYPGVSRHYYYRWDKDTGVDGKKTTERYGIEKPTIPELYIVDTPSTAHNFIEFQTATNVALEFMIGVYHSRDIPQVADQYDTELPEPIVMFPWRSVAIFNHAKGIFEHTADVSSACRRVPKLTP